MKFHDWDKRRAKLHHDWLLNSYITFLEAQKDTLNDPSGFKEDIDSILDQLKVWDTKQSSLLKFIKNAEEALSPRQLTDEHPLTNLSVDERHWLGEVVHAHYLQKSSIRESTILLNAAIHEVEQLVAFASTGFSGEQGAYPVNCGDALLKKVLDLSSLISSLPHAIQVPHGVS